MTNKYLVTAKRKRGLNWSTQVEANSFANAVDNGLKSHYDAGFSHIAKKLNFLFTFSPKKLHKSKQIVYFALFKSNLRIVHEQFTKKQN